MDKDTDRPDLSVVIPAVNDFEDLRGCLAALATGQDAKIEPIVVDRTGELLRYHAAREFPSARIVAVPPGTTIPEMRAIGIKAARADFVGVIEDHVIVPDRWARRMIDAFEPGAGAVGGPVENAAVERYVDRAAFICEYNSTLGVLPEGESDWLPGNNVVYRRQTLERHAAVLDEHRWEYRLHDAIREGGETLLMRPDIVVGHKMHYSVGLYMSQRYLYSRSYAGPRARELSAPKRIVMAGASAVALPPVMLLRIWRQVRAHGKYTSEFYRSVPLQICFVAAWGAGEAVGYLLGPGNALSRIR